MDTVILPAKNKNTSFIERVVVKPGFVMGTTVGLKKKINEDRIGFTLKEEGGLRICIADGHWGNKSAEIITEYWLNNERFPHSRYDSIALTQKLSKQLFETFVRPNTDYQINRSPEASFLALDINNTSIQFVGYGDCRLLISRGGNILYTYKINETWLGVRAYSDSDQCLSIDKATIYKKIKLQKDDFIFMFTDGIDECVYETPTITYEEIAQMTALNNPVKVFGSLFKRIVKFGAEDNASLAIIKI